VANPVLCSRRRWFGVVDVAAAVLNATSRSVMKAGVGLHRVGPASGGTETTSGGASVAGEMCNISASPGDSRCFVPVNMSSTVSETDRQFSVNQQAHPY
jgi:hypothetical protein